MIPDERFLPLKMDTWTPPGHRTYRFFYIGGSVFQSSLRDGQYTTVCVSLREPELIIVCSSSRKAITAGDLGRDLLVVYLAAESPLNGPAVKRVPAGESESLGLVERGLMSSGGIRLCVPRAFSSRINI